MKQYQSLLYRIDQSDSLKVLEAIIGIRTILSPEGKSTRRLTI
jgi:hypothetical protein